MVTAIFLHCSVTKIKELNNYSPVCIKTQTNISNILKLSAGLRITSQESTFLHRSNFLAVNVSVTMAGNQRTQKLPSRLLIMRYGWLPQKIIKPNMPVLFLKSAGGRHYIATKPLPRALLGSCQNVGSAEHTYK